VLRSRGIVAAGGVAGRLYADRKCNIRFNEYRMGNCADCSSLVRSLLGGRWNHNADSAFADCALGLCTVALVRAKLLAFEAAGE